jgi:DNA-directed RNA polymerase I, II, and III subunit RPABC3
MIIVRSDIELPKMTHLESWTSKDLRSDECLSDQRMNEDGREDGGGLYILALKPKSSASPAPSLQFCVRGSLTSLTRPAQTKDLSSHAQPLPPPFYTRIDKPLNFHTPTTKPSTMADATLFDDTFTLTSLNNQKYDRVSRLTGTSTDSSTILSLDINHEIYPCAVGETLQVVLASTLNLDGTKEDVSKGWREKGAEENSLADMFDYVCWGKVYRFEEGEGENM